MRDIVRVAIILWAAVRAIFTRGASGSTRFDLTPRRRSHPVRRKVLEYATVFGIAGLIGFVVASLGLVSIRASSGHWAITEWFLDYTKTRSVTTHSLGVEVPSNLDEPSMILRGAGHYESGCAPCHGSPLMPQPRIAAAMTPVPPYLSSSVKKFDDAELFYIVRHGIKMTGMPAWPAQKRTDEVWALVAFLRQFPSLGRDDYEALVMGDGADFEPVPISDMDGAVAPTLVRTSCARCHGVTGQGRGNGAFPRLSGQKYEYLVRSLAAYAGGGRHSGIMQPVAAGLDADEIADLARYYSRVQRERLAIAADPDAVARGAHIAEFGIPHDRVPACRDCHGPDSAETNPAYPTLAAQYPEYLMLQLQLFRESIRGGSRYSHIMHDVAHDLDDDDMRAVAHYYGSIAP